MTEQPALTKVILASDKEDHYVYIDKTAIRAIQVQLPVETSLVTIEGMNGKGVVRVYLTNMTAPFQFVRNTAEETLAVAKQLLP